ncbi:MAG: 2-oxoglutarate dehydrogenase E1 component [Hydrotalea sp.]|nr:2-oxoglutarate dehydrogenase E1 component [Hydrotalea sp.]
MEDKIGDKEISSASATDGKSSPATASSRGASSAQAKNHGNDSSKDLAAHFPPELLMGGADYIFDLYQRYLQNPNLVGKDWQEVFVAIDKDDKDAKDADEGLKQHTGDFVSAADYKPSWVFDGSRGNNGTANNDNNGAVNNGRPAFPQHGAVIDSGRTRGAGGKTLSDFLLSGMAKGENLQETIARYISDHGVAGEREMAERLNSIRAIMLIRAFRTRGHLEADLDPLQLSPKVTFPELDYHSYGFTDADLDKTIYINYYLGLESARLRDIIGICRKVYCGRFAIEFMHVQDPDEKLWLQEMVEADYAGKSVSAEKKKNIYQQVLQAEAFESFLDKKYKGAKRFGLDGGESTIPVLDEIINRGVALGIEEVDIGMSHRGRLNVLANILGKPYRQIFYEFYGGSPTPANLPQMGDVKYHLGASHDAIITDASGESRTVHLSLSPNPSHLEAVNTVVLGKVRAKQKQRNDTKKEKVMAVLIHGDAAFIGQGVVAETFLLSQLKGYRTGGTIHIAVNNQIGFTTVPKEGRSSPYCTDMAKMIDAPVFHVNGDDPETCVRAAQLAVEYRQKFKKDIVIDIYCYRRHGHNETDEPFFTQPLMYEKIASHPHLTTIYSEKLIAEKILTQGEVDGRAKDFNDRLENALLLAKDFKPAKVDWLEGRWHGLTMAETGKRKGDTAADIDVIREIGEKLTTVPANFTIHPKIDNLLKTKKESIENGAKIDWGTAEALGYGSLLLEGVPIRLSGEDSERGTFSNRHAVWIDQKNGNQYVPLNHLRAGQSQFEVINSPLSEFGLLGFEYGYSTAEPFSLVLWEAQFGDFANGAQVIIDQFIAAGETKWFKMCGLVMLLPHGYEGQGPEHSSARLERYLQLSADDNWQVCNLTTPANYFHALRRQIKRNFRKPLIIMTPKSLLRHPLCVSRIEDFIAGSSFRRILPDDAFVAGTLSPPEQFKKVILCSGKVYYDLYQAREKMDRKDIAIVRLEQLYPFPDESLLGILQKCKQAEFVWCQEEPENSGAWFFVRPRIEKLLRQLKATHQDLIYVGRREAASPAVGSAKIHTYEQETLVVEALK